jgi:homoserine kinase
VIVRVPASSANLGPGFDTLGMALTVYAEIGSVDSSPVDLPPSARLIDEHHPASIAHRRAGGTGQLWERSSIPAGRGLGFSGAVRVGGALLATAQQTGATLVGDDDRAGVLALVTELEGHADNVAASLYGGVVATAAGRVVRVPLGVDPAIVVWIPSFVTKTDESRRTLGAPVPFDDVVFNLGRVAILVAALAAGDVGSLRTAVEDRLHQPSRLAQSAPSRAAIDAAHQAGAWAAWLSGSGPTVAAMCAAEDADAIAAALADDGHTKVLSIDHRGAVIVDTYTR